MSRVRQRGSLGACAGVLALLALAMDTPRAMVVVSVAPRRVESSFELPASSDGGSLRLTPLEVPALEGRAVAQATGVAPPRQARGTAMVRYNLPPEGLGGLAVGFGSLAAGLGCLAEAFSSDPCSAPEAAPRDLALPTGARMRACRETRDGTTCSDVELRTVAPGTLHLGGPAVAFEVRAERPGPAGNVPAGTTVVVDWPRRGRPPIDAWLSATLEAPVVGGEAGGGPALTQRDIDLATAGLDAALRRSARLRAADLARARDAVVVDPGEFRVFISPDVPAGTETASTDLHGSVYLRTMLAPRAAVVSAAAKQLQASAPAGLHVLRQSIVVDSVERGSGPVLRVHAHAVATPIDPGRVRDAGAGRSPDALDAEVRRLDATARVTVRGNLPWLPVLPPLPDRIAVTVDGYGG